MSASGSLRRAIATSDDVELIMPENPVPVAPGGSESTGIFVVAPRASFERGKRIVMLRIDDGVDFDLTRGFQTRADVERVGLGGAA